MLYFSCPKRKSSFIGVRPNPQLVCPPECCFCPHFLLSTCPLDSRIYTGRVSSLVEYIILFFSPRLTLHNVDDRMAGKYRCIGKNRLGTIQNDFQLLIRGMKTNSFCFVILYLILKGSIYWRRFPESETVKINDSIILKCEGESSEPLQYHW